MPQLNHLCSSWSCNLQELYIDAVWLAKFTCHQHLPGHALRQYLVQDLALFSPVIFDNISTVWPLEIGNVLLAHYEAGRQEVNIIPIRGQTTEVPTVDTQCNGFKGGVSSCKQTKDHQVEPGTR